MAAKKNPKGIEILLVEDNIGDIELAKEAFQDADIQSRISMVRDGEEALDFLYQRGQYRDSPRPELVLMDLNMPRKNGLDVLSIIKEDSCLKDIPVIILTSSESDHDISSSYKLHANAYIVKPSDLSDYVTLVNGIKNFWVDIAKLPPRQRTTPLKSGAFL